MNEIKEKIPRIGMVSLGCPKALVDSERILTQLRAQGYELVKHYQDADLVVVNTCGFIDAAVEESLDAIGESSMRCTNICRHAMTPSLTWFRHRGLS